jgi:hypothetical protein
LEIPVMNIESGTLKKVIDWIEHWKSTPQPSNEDIKDKVCDSIDPWDEEYLEMKLEQLYELVSSLNKIISHLHIYCNFCIVLDLCR